MMAFWPGGYSTICPVCGRSKTHKTKKEANAEYGYLKKRIKESFSIRLPYVSKPLGRMTLIPNRMEK